MNPEHQEFHSFDAAVHASIAERDAEIASLRARLAEAERERDEAKAEAERLRVIARDTDPVLRRKIESLEKGLQQARLVWESQIKGVEGQRDAAKTENDKLIRMLQDAFSAMLDAGLDNSYTAVSDEIRRFFQGGP